MKTLINFAVGFLMAVSSTPQVSWALNYGIPTYDSSDTWIKFETHYKLEKKLPEYPYISTWGGSGTRIGNYIITNGHVVCSPQNHRKVWLSFSDRFSYLKHFNLPTQFPKLVQEEFETYKSKSEVKNYPNKALQFLNESAIEFSVFLPKEYECNLQNPKSRYDLAILKPTRKEDLHFFKSQAKIKKISCALPEKGKLSWILAGGTRDFGLNHPAYPPQKHQTALGAFEIIHPQFHINTYPLGWMNAGYRSAQLRSNPKMSHTFFMGQFNDGDSGAGFLQTDCTTQNHLQCLNRVFKNKLIFVDPTNQQFETLEESLQEFLIANNYYYAIHPEASFSNHPFWGIVSGGDQEQNTFAPTFYENRKFLREHLPKEMLSDNCFKD